MKLYIPDKCKVGFQLREETYTEKLGYIIYHDGKLWRKEPSWEGWRHKTNSVEYYWEGDQRYTKDVVREGVEPIEFDNVPTEGFVLNKKVGGYSSGWNYRQTYCRVYDPRGWEFEITVSNLLYILQECSSFKGKGLEGKFVYSWDGKDLVLLPISSPDYQECVKFTNVQSGKVLKKELKEGRLYLTSKLEKVLYLGEYKIYDLKYGENRTKLEYKIFDESPSSDILGKRMCFRKIIEDDKYNYNKYYFLSNLSTIKELTSDDIDPNFSDYVDELQKSSHCGEPDHLEIISITTDENYAENFFKCPSCTRIFKFGNINSVDDFNTLVRVIDKNKNEEDSFDISVLKYERMSRNWYSYNSSYKLEKTLTRDEVINEFGVLCRVYKNGYKKII